MNVQDFSSFAGRNGDAANHSFFWNEVEGVPGYPDEGRHERVQVQSSRRESEAPGEEGEEVKSPKRKVNRVPPEETLDSVRAMELGQEEAEEISFVPSAISSAKAPVSV